MTLSKLKRPPTGDTKVGLKRKVSANQNAKTLTFLLEPKLVSKLKCTCDCRERMQLYMTIFCSPLILYRKSKSHCLHLQLKTVH